MNIRGQEIDLNLFEEEINYLKTLEWKFKKWIPTPAIRDNSGATQKYTGQKYDASKWQYLDTGWTHDHCEICSITLYESDDVDDGFAFTNEYWYWICYECFGKIIRNNFVENEIVLKHKLLLKNEHAALFISPMVPNFRFEIKEDTKFGDCPIEKHLDIPRKILRNGKPDLKTLTIFLKYSEDLKMFEEEELYRLTTE